MPNCPPPLWVISREKRTTRKGQTGHRSVDEAIRPHRGSVGHSTKSDKKRWGDKKKSQAESVDVGCGTDKTGSRRERKETFPFRPNFTPLTEEPLPGLRSYIHFLPPASFVELMETLGFLGPVHHMHRNGLILLILLTLGPSRLVILPRG